LRCTREIPLELRRAVGGGVGREDALAAAMPDGLTLGVIEVGEVAERIGRGMRDEYL
jgi:hypothetical protein